MGRCAWQGCFAVQSGHGVIVSISDGLRACQAADFGFRDIGREPAVLPFPARASEDPPVETAELPAVGMDGPVGPGFQAARRDGPRAGAALTLRRRHGAACCFLRVSRYESVCSPRVTER